MKNLRLFRPNCIRTSTATRCLLLAAIPASLILASCNVTRTVTTESQYWQKGDTSCTIVTKTVETYDASKKL